MYTAHIPKTTATTTTTSTIKTKEEKKNNQQYETLKEADQAECHSTPNPSE
jgi:hypothetical protein